MSAESGFQVDDSAPRYYENHVERFMAPFVRSLVASAVKPGDVVLDVAAVLVSLPGQHRLLQAHPGA